jgi:hypothetical protein
MDSLSVEFSGVLGGYRHEAACALFLTEEVLAETLSH